MTERCFCTDFSKDREFRMMFWNVWVEPGLWKVMQTFLEIAYQKPDYFLTPASTTCYLHHKYFSCRNTCKKSILRRRKDLTDQNKQGTDTMSATELFITAFASLYVKTGNLIQILVIDPPSWWRNFISKHSSYTQKIVPSNQLYLHLPINSASFKPRNFLYL